MVFHRPESFGGIGVGVAAVRCGLDGLSSPPCLLTYLDMMLARRSSLRYPVEHTILYIGTEPYVIATKPTMTLKT